MSAELEKLAVNKLGNQELSNWDYHIIQTTAAVILEWAEENKRYGEMKFVREEKAVIMFDDLRKLLEPSGE